MKRINWKATAAMTVAAIVIGSAHMGKPCDAFALGFTPVENQGTVIAPDVNMDANNSSLRFCNLGVLGKVFNDAIGNKNGFGVDESSETMPGLLTLFILAVSLIGVALMPKPFHSKRESKPMMKPGALRNFRNAKRQSALSPRREPVALDNPLIASHLTLS